VEIKAAVLAAMEASAPYATSQPLTLETLQLDPPGPGEVLVRIKAAGLCHSDLSVINGNRPRPMPMALGHEAAGIVEEVGPVEGAGRSDLEPGDHVVFVFVPSCGHCEPCTVGRPALCEPGAAANGAGTLLSGARRLRRSDGTAVNHHLGVSAFADYATVSRHSSAVASIRRARGSSASPARVRRTPSGRRANSRAPSSRSRWPTCRLTAGWAMYSRSEARVKLPSSATATK